MRFPGTPNTKKAARISPTALHATLMVASSSAANTSDSGTCCAAKRTFNAVHHSDRLSHPRNRIQSTNTDELPTIAWKSCASLPMTRTLISQPIRATCGLCRRIQTSITTTKRETVNIKWSPKLLPTNLETRKLS